MCFPNVNFLRAAAALRVLVYRVIELTPWPEFPKGGALLVFRVGWAGVDPFFLISGFVIGLSAIRRFRRACPFASGRRDRAPRGRASGHVPRTW